MSTNKNNHDQTSDKDVDKLPDYVMDIPQPNGEAEQIAVYRSDTKKLDLMTGNTEFESIELADEGVVNLSHLFPTENMTLDVTGSKPGVWINGMMTLRGQTSLAFPNGEGVQLNPTQGCGFQYSGETATFTIPAQEELATFGVTLSDEIFRRYVGDDVPDSVLRLLEPAELHKLMPFPISHNMHAAVEAAIQPGLTGSLRRLQIEGAALVFISYLANAIDKHFTMYGAGISSSEINSAREAYEVLLLNISDPPRMADLAKGVGLTEAHLNRAFHELYGGTVFEVWRRLRLEQAREMLEVGDMAIKEIAHAVGYAHVSNFSSAFASHFGTPPATYAKQIRS